MLVTSVMMSILRAACVNLLQPHVPDRRKLWFKPNLMFWALEMQWSM